MGAESPFFSLFRLRLPNELVGGCVRLLWLFAYGSLLGALWAAYGFAFRDAYGSAPAGGAAAYGLLDAGAADAAFLDRPPKSDAFLLSRSPVSFSLSDFLRPKGIVAVSQSVDCRWCEKRRQRRMRFDLLMS